MNNYLLQSLQRAARAVAVAALSCLGLFAPGAQAQTSLFDQPPNVSAGIPGNLLLVLSVEYPTALSIANSATYAPATTYVGYFDPAKCYTYVYGSTSGASGTYVLNTDQNVTYFSPVGTAGANHACTGQWSGNFLNWATMQTIDPFRWALTGGYRVVDTTTTTILEKAWASGQGGSGETPTQTISTAATIAGATPFNWSTLKIRLWGLGNRLDFTSTGTLPTANLDTTDTPYNGVPGSVNAGTLYSVKARVLVCVAGMLESNCNTQYPLPKPEGLIQQYSQTVRVGAMGYLNDSGILRDAGVLRAPMGFVGPTIPAYGGIPASANAAAEWSGTTGIFVQNPDNADLAATNTSSCTNGGATVPCAQYSGVVNYLNDFGETSHTYKTYDPVSELYYAAVRYYKNLGNVTQWSDTSTLSAATRYTEVDGFPVVTTWANPILYSCQKNFILGIGDVNTHASGNVAGLWGTQTQAAYSKTYNPSALSPKTALSQYTASNEPTVEAGVVADTTIDAVAATNFVGQAEVINSGAAINRVSGPLGQTNVPWCCGDDATYYMAGLAYDAHVNDMQPTNFTTNNTGANGQKLNIQTATTYWLDVQEYQTYYYQNQFWLAAKYGGFPIANNYVPWSLPSAANGVGSLGNWATGANQASGTTYSTGNGTATAVGDKPQPGGTGKAIPDNYFGAGNAAAMVSGLTNAFKQISQAVTQPTAPFSFSSPNFASSGSVTYSSGYTSNWTGDITASTTTLDPVTGNPIFTTLWDEDEANGKSLPSYLDNQASGTGWNTARFIATYNPSTGKGVPFRFGNVPASMTASFNQIPGVLAANQNSQNYLNYLRGDRSNEGGNGAGYRTRSTLLGDIVDSKLTVVGAPQNGYLESSNAGYTAYTSAQQNRETVVYVGANDGFMHAFLGGTGGGQELFAYAPSPVFNGPSGTPTTNGLAALGNATFTHHYYVDATPNSFDIDFAKAGGANGSGNWHTVIIGGLGKGGMGYYALDVTNPSTLSNETALSSAVLWEFSSVNDSRMGYSFGDATVMKTAKYGWVVVLLSGYDNSDGHGHMFFLNPTNGAVLETVTTPDNGTPASPSGLAWATAYAPNFGDQTADALYAGDLLGNMWRVDLTTLGSYQNALVQFAKVTDGSGKAQPITTNPIVSVDPATNKRYVLFGTGELLGSPDLNSTQQQDYYAIQDGYGTSGAFWTASNLPSGVSFPIQRSNLVGLTTTQLLGSTALVYGAGIDGWYLDLGFGPNGVAYRINISSTESYGNIGFAANQPVGDVCSTGGSHVDYSIQFGSGQTSLTDANGNAIVSQSFSGLAYSIAYVQQFQSNGAAGSTQLIEGTTNLGKPAQHASALKRLNWRVIPSAN